MTVQLTSIAAIAVLAASQVFAQTPSTPRSPPTRRAISSDATPLLDPHLIATAEGLRDKALKDNIAYSLLEGLTTEIGPRPDASEAEHRAADWAAAKLRALGFENVHLEPFAMDEWIRGQETAEVVSPFPQRLVLTALGGSVATQAEGVTAEATIFKTYDELLATPIGSLKGKIAVVTQPMARTGDGSGYGANYQIRGLGPSEAARRGAVAYLLRSLATDRHREPHTGALQYEADAPKIPAAALSVPDAEQLDRIALRGQPIRLHVTLTPTLRPNATSYTVIGELKGREKPEEVVLIGGHLDSWDLGTGAIDDGAGVAITTAAAKLIADLPQRPRRTIRIALFGAEERGVSNFAYVAAHGAADQAKTAIASECDFGADRIYAIALPKGAAGSSFGRTLGRVTAPIGVTISAKPAQDGGSDLESLVSVPLASLAQDGTRYFDIHHTADDTLDKIDREQMNQNVAAWAAFTYLAADSDVDFRALAVSAPAR
jgi:Zn-dependent M28 family amino/carboxypeptidase